MSSLSDALSTLSDRGLRRLLGARTFLRGLDYEKRKVVEDVSVNESSAQGRVKGSDPDPYEVAIRLGGEGITSSCTCPAFQKTNQHCKHVAALLITVRNKARSQLPRREAPVQPQQHAPVVQQSNGADPKGGRRRDRRRRQQQAPQLPTPVSHYTPHAAPTPDMSARPTGIGAWLAPDGTQRTLHLEFRVHVRQGGLTVTVLDIDNRTPLLPSVALNWQSVIPTLDRNALRVLARFESGNPRHPAVDIRGEDASELLPLLRDRRVLLEPALMQLRFAEEPLRPRFDLEMVGADTIVSKVTFERQNDGRRFQLTTGGWFEGAPGYHIDTTEGIARPLDHRVSPAALRRLLRSPTIAEPASELIGMITYGLPKVALEIGAELPELSQVADVIDLEPTFRMRATGSLTEAEVSLRAAYADLEVEVRADGISPPVMILPPVEGQKRAKCIRCDIAAQQRAVQLLLDLGLQPDESGERFVARADRAIQFWSEGVGALPEDWDLYVPEHLVGTHVRSKPILMHARVSSGVDWLNVKINYESEGVGVEREELERCLREGKKFVRLSDNSFAPFDGEKVQAMIDREIELITAAGKSGKIPLSQAGRVQELLNQATSATVAANTKQLFQK
ncbi:MAG TPA: SNF2 helicase associated domain-containing protein, partial [Polyangiaceae bacterium]|nr:SNF2 helicase associated domain-containing protein [Polyangiaceae bacterium]